MREMGLDDFLLEWPREDAACICGGSWFLLLTQHQGLSPAAEGMEMNDPAAAVPGYVQCALLSFFGVVMTLKPLPA